MLEKLMGLLDGSKDSLDDYGVFLLMDEISLSSVKPAIEWILRNELSDDPLPQLTLVICSEGGDVYAAFALIDAIRGAKHPIKMIGLGEVSSAALSIFMAGTKGKRILTPNTICLSHQYSSMTFGKEHELFAARKGFDLLSDMVMRHYVSCTGLSEDAVRKYLLPEADLYLSAFEAQKLGICDEVRTMSGENN